MFLRRCQRRKSGKRHTYWALVESYRTARGSRQRVVAYLGDLAPSEQDGWAKLGAHLQGDEAARRPQRTLFDPPGAPNAGDEEPVKVRLKDIRLERLGRLKERFWRASQAFDVTIRKLPQPIGKQHLEVIWIRNEKFHEWSQLVDGCYLLRTNLTGVDPARHAAAARLIGGVAAQTVFLQIHMRDDCFSKVLG
jgi:hypothetical protein